MKPIEIVEELNARNTLMPGKDKHLGPGGLIEKLSEEKRKILSELKSDDLKNIRPDSIGLNQKKGRGRWGNRKS